MAQDFRALFAPGGGQDFKTLFAPDEISEEEANRTLTPEEQAMVARANEPRFGAGLAKRMAEYQGLSPEDASAKYRAGWADTISNIYGTVTDPKKLASVAGHAVEAGIGAVSDPKGTARRIGNYYYENPDAAVTDAAFAAFPGRQAVSLVGKTVQRAPSNAMPRASVREGGELLKTGGNRMEDAKLNPSRVDKEALVAPLEGFKRATKTTVITSPIVSNIAKRLETAHTPNRPGAMDAVTRVGPKPKPDLTLTELHGHLQRLDDFIGKGGKGADGRINNQGRAAIELKKAIGKMIDDHPDGGDFKIGKGEVHRGKMDQTMGDLLKAAQKRRQWVNGDEAGALSAEVGQFLKNKKNRYAFTPEIRQKLDKLSSDKKGRLIGAFGATNVGGFTFARIAETALGLPAGVGMIAGVPARNARNARLVAEFKEIQEEIRAGGPVER
jgi:hypothetical protein